jgi:Leucine-rich repeat (LRR) protein
MRYVLMVLFLLVYALVSAQTGQSPDQIRQKMAEIRRTTNWDDPTAAKKANEDIRELAKQLLLSGGQQGVKGTGSGSGPGNQQGQADSNDAKELAEINQEMAQQKVDLFSQIWKAAAGGEGADILLAEPLRKEIVDEYKNEDNPQSIPFVAEELEVLVIDMSMIGIQAIIDIMPLYKSIKTLVITSSQSPLPVDLQAILKNAVDYPLKELYIVNLGIYVTKFPKEVAQFKSLSTLGIFNNRLTQLPVEIEGLNNLKKLYADNNPIKTTFPVLNTLRNLEELGLINTEVPESEISLIENMYPTCKVITR